MQEILLADGIKYRLWDPKTEEKLEDAIKEHAQDIFGEQSIYLDRKQKLKSLSGIGSIPDGYIIMTTSEPMWFICEVELHGHQLYDHIVPQVTKFINGIKSYDTQRALTEALYNEIISDNDKKEIIKKRIGNKEIHLMLSELLSRPPGIVIVIDKRTAELDEVCNVVPGKPRVIEFKTFEQLGNNEEHAHLFEPIGVYEAEQTCSTLLDELRLAIHNSRPSIKAQKPTDRYCKISLGHTGIHLEWLLWGKEKLGVELHLEKPELLESSTLLKVVEFQKDRIIKYINEPIQFESQWGKHWSRAYTLKEIKDTPEFKDWAVETMIKFYDVFKPFFDQIE